MPKVNDLKAYYREIATKAGLDKEKLEQVMAVMEDDKFAKAFTDGFKPLPDYSHDLDDVRKKTKDEKDAEYKTWHDQELKKYNEYLASLDRLKKYEDLYGPVDNTTTTTSTDTSRGGPVLSKEDIEKLMDTKMADTLSRRDSAVLDLLELRESHMGTFKKPLDVKAFEAAWKEHPEWGGSMKPAYNEWVGPEVKKIETTQWEQKLKEAREEGIRDGYSRRALPADHEPKTFSPLFDRKEDVAKLSEGEQEKHSRTAFFEGLRSDNKQPA